jgi:TP901 family phage tail tape measure protein
MANVVGGTIIWNLDVAMEKFKAGLAEAKGEISTFGKETGEGIKNVSKSLGVAGGALAGIGAATAAAVKVSVSSFAEFDREIKNAVANVRANEYTLEAFRKTALDASAGTVFSATEAANALSFLAGGTISAEEAMDSLADTLQFAMATGLDLQQATLVTSQALSLFKLEAEDVTGVLDILTRSSQISFATTDQMASAFAEAAPIAAQLGIDIIDLTAILGTMGDAGILGTEAGVALKRAFRELISPTKQTVDALAELGLSAEDVKNKISDPIALLKVFEEALEDIQDPVERAAVLSSVFGNISGPAMAGLLQLGTDAIEEQRDMLHTAEGAMQDAADRAKSAVDPFKDLAGEFKRIQFSLAKAVLPALRDLNRIFTPIIRVTSTLIDKNPKLAVGLTIAGIAAGILGAALLTVAGVAALLSAPFALMGVGIAAAVMLAVGWFVFFGMQLKRLWDFTKTVFEWFKTVPDIFKTWRERGASDFSQFSGDFKQLLSTMSSGWEEIKEQSSQAASFIKTEFIDKMVSGYFFLVENTETFASFHKNIILNIVKDWETMKTGAQVAQEFIIDKVIEPLKFGFEGLGSHIQVKFFNPVKEWWQELLLDLDFGKNLIIEHVIEPLKFGFDGWATYLANKFSFVIDAWDKLVSKIKSGVEEIKEQLGNIPFLSGGRMLDLGISRLFGGARAMDGPVSAGKSYLVGKRGPEMFVPSTSGTIVPGGNSLTISNINIGSDVDADGFLRKLEDFFAGKSVASQFGL